jgi:hypothetical protein
MKKYYKENLIGKRYGKLLIKDVIEKSNSIRKDGIFICDCDCGNTNVEIKANGVFQGRSYSCGCERDKNKFKKLCNNYNLNGEYGIGYTLKNEPFYFDLEDYDIIKGYCWFYSETEYLHANDGNGSIVKMHRLIFNLNKEDKMDIVDHKDGRHYDNRKENLRVCNRSQNGMNTYIKPNKTTGIRGITFSKQHNKYRVRITLKCEVIHIGYFENLEDAIKARLDAEEIYFGEFSYKNSRIKE